MTATHAPSASNSPQFSRSTVGVDALIAQATARYEAATLATTLSPLFPESCPWNAVASIPEQPAYRLRHQLSSVTAAVVDYRSSLTASAGQLAAWLDATDEDVRELAMEFAQRRLPATNKLEWAERVLCAPIPGETEATRTARVNDARFWRRAIRVLLLREREHFFLRLRLVGKDAEAYVSDVQLSARLAQLKRQAQWMKETVLVPRYLAPGDATDGLLTLDKVASSPRTRFAKLYAFVKAMDAIAIEQGLATCMLTFTLEPEWHPNPSHGENSWNGASPRDAHQSLATRWQSILRDLDRLGVGVSGLRVVEPHKDACPHWHLWLLYRPQSEQSILQTVMRYFPLKLKVRAPRAKGSKAAAGDRIFDTLENLKTNTPRVPVHRKEGAQVELARIDRKISSGASYAMKYLLKTVDGGDQLNAQAGLFPEAPGVAPALTAEQKKRRTEYQSVAKRVDAYRGLWGINAGQLFGVAKCLTAWDELRRLANAPSHPLLKSLWALARGGDKEGRIGAGESVQGDAKGFIQALGGLAACGKTARGAARISIGRLTETALNGYGEEIDRTTGVTLVERTRARVAVGERTSKVTGEIKLKMALRSIKTVLASIQTRVGNWSLAPKKNEKLAVYLAEQRFLAQVNEDTSAHKGSLAVRAFWSAMWDAVAAPPPESPPFSLWLLAPA